MGDPFASLDPIQKPKTAAERVLTSPVYNHPPPGAPVAAAPFGGGNMGGHMGGMGMDMGMGGMAPGMGMGMNMNMNMSMNMGPNMGMGGGMGMMNMGGMNPSMGGMGMGMGQHQPNPFQQQQQQQQQPVMYDNIKNLLQQKPKTPAAFEDTASMDFLENLGGGGGASGSVFGSAKTNSGSLPSSSNPQVRAAEPTSVVADPFGGSGFGASPTAVSGDIGLSIFETGGSNAALPSSASSSTSATSGGGSKSSALADRLANGRRKTQEMQRSQLQLNANSFAHSGGGGAVPKISLKEMAEQSLASSSKGFASNELSLDDFSSGSGGGASASTKTASGDFGSSDPFEGGGSSSGSAAPRQSSFGGTLSQEDSGPKPVDENDNTFW